MELTPYMENLRRDLSAAAAAGGAEVTRAADLLSGSLESSVRLCLLEALSDAAAEITTRLAHGAVELRLRGREAEFVVTESESEPVPQQPPMPAAAPGDDGGDITRITLRLPEALKEAVEAAAAAEGVSVNAWLVRAIAQMLAGPPGPPMPPMPPRAEWPGRGRRGRRMTGFAEA
jgi:hypothetical protein